MLLLPCCIAADVRLLCTRDIKCCQIDDAEDAQIVSVLLDPPIPDGFDVCNTEIMPGVPNLAYNLQVKLLLPSYVFFQYRTAVATQAVLTLTLTFYFMPLKWARMLQN